MSEQYTRKPFSKKLREILFDKYGGKCAYCGKTLKEGKWNIDHINPFFLAHFEPDLDPNREENLNPACKKCNMFKSAFRLEDFRRELQLQVHRLKQSAQFNRALVYNQVKIVEKPIVFFFEQQAKTTRTLNKGKE